MPRKPTWKQTVKRAQADATLCQIAVAMAQSARAGTPDPLAPLAFADRVEDLGLILPDGYLDHLRFVLQHDELGRELARRLRVLEQTEGRVPLTWIELSGFELGVEGGPRMLFVSLRTIGTATLIRTFALRRDLIRARVGYLERRAAEVARVWRERLEQMGRAIRDAAAGAAQTI